MLKKMFRNAFYYIIKPSPITEKKIKTFYKLYYLNGTKQEI